MQTTKKWKTPRLLADPSIVEFRKQQNQLFAPHVAELNNLVIKIRKIRPCDNSIPWFDPAGAGINARVLMLLQDPSTVASLGTGLISPDNPDRTADNTTYFRNLAKINPTELVHWNIVPWSMVKKFSIEIEDARPYLLELLVILKDLEVVVCMGENAKKGWNQVNKCNICYKGWSELPSDIKINPIVLSCPHPSWQSVYGYHPLIDNMTSAQRIEKTLLNVRKLLDM